MPPTVDSTAIHSLIEQALRTVNAKILENHVFEPDLPLAGTGGVLDSIDTILFLEETEDLFSERMGVPVTLVTETVFERRPNPFQSVRSLTAYIAEVLAGHEKVEGDSDFK